MKEMDLEQTFKDFVALINKIENSILNKIANELLVEYKEEIMNRAASPDRYENGKYVVGGHHFFKGGLLCHLYGAAKMALKMTEDYDVPIDIDILLFGAAFHDIGKIYTYEKWDDNRDLKNPSTIYAKMVQHSYMGMDILSKKFDKYNELDSEIKLQILHIIASHMDDYEGGIVKPSTLEAKIVRYAERADCALTNSKIN